MNKVSSLRITAVYSSHVCSAAKSYLDDMHYANGASCVPEKRCLPGTRVGLLDSISSHLLGGITAKGQDSARITLLTGVAGSGKSAVAHEIAHRFKSLGRLGVSFCFSASHLAERPVDRLLSTISRNLAVLDEGWRAALVDVIKSDKELRTTRSPKEQFDNFIVKPAQKLRFIGPIVVVIDAIDEVAEKDRLSLVYCLTRLAEDKDIPSNIRFLITSRPEPRMVADLAQLADVDVQDISNGTVETRNDIRIFVDRELTSKFPEPKRAEVRQHWIPFLVERAENLFQWAATACAFITLKSVGSTPEKRFQKLQEGGHSILHSLYGTILDELVENITRNDPSITKVDILAKVRRVLALILTAREPLGWMAWMALLSGDTLQEFLEVVPFLGSLLLGTSAYSLEPVKPLHTSFRDYTTLPGGTYTVDIAAAEMTLSTLSFLVMEDNLKFNICDLETSYLANKDVPDLSGRIQHNISYALVYACRFWAAHLAATQYKQFSLGTLFLFLDTGLLYWIEVISLLGVVDSASLGIKEVREWIQVSVLWFECTDEASHSGLRNHHPRWTSSSAAWTRCSAMSTSFCRFVALPHPFPPLTCTFLLQHTSLKHHLYTAAIRMFMIGAFVSLTGKTCTGPRAPSPSIPITGLTVLLFFQITVSSRWLTLAARLRSGMQ